MKLPLLQGAGADSPLFLRDGEVALTRGRFVAAAQALAAQLPAGGPLLNLCESRAAFAIGLAGAMLRERPCVLPPSGAPEVVRQVAAAAGAQLALVDRIGQAAGLPHLSIDERMAAPVVAEVPQLPDGQLVAIAYTSGSSGTPQPHEKTWGALVRTAQLAAARFFEGLGRVAIVGTVPAQHMYGLETTVIMGLAGPHVLSCAKPFFPADVAAALASLPAPRVLITTPVHLRALVAAGVSLPPLARIISATAPLPVELARAAEALAGAQVHEIYGCTEAGSMASRRTSETETWTLYPGMRLTPDDDGGNVDCAHLPHAVRLTDQLETQDGVRFRLLGRSADTLKVAGKRISLAELTAQLTAIPGVEDGVVFQADSASVVQRPAALVVAPNLTEAQVLDALARKVDPVFLPRPLRKVAALPRNELGKLPRARLLELLGG